MPVTVKRSNTINGKNMKKLIVSAGLVAIGATVLESAKADDNGNASTSSPAAGSAISPNYWSVGATLRGFYDSDYDIANNGKGSSGIEFLPTVSFHEPLRQTDIGLRYTYGLYYYQDRQNLGVNPFDQTHQVDAWVDHAFNERWKANVQDTFAVGQEPELLQPNPVTAVAVPYRVNGNNLANHGTLELNTEWTRLFGTTLTYNNGYYNYDNSGAFVNSSGMLVLPDGTAGPSLAGILNRIEQSASIDFNWHIQPETIILVGYEFSWVNYTADEPIAIINTLAGPFIYHSGDRDNRSQYGYVGIVEQFTPNLSGSVRAGATYTDVYADPLFPSTSWNPYADLSLTYTYNPGSYLQFGFTHDISATDQVAPDAAGQITQYADDSVIYVDVNQRITSKLTGSVIGRVQYSTFQGGIAGGEDETDYGVGINLTYQINQYFSVDAGYNYDDVVTQIPGYAYNRHRVYLGVTATY